MNLYNATPFAAAYSMGIQKSGRNCLVVVAKATYKLPLAEQPAELAEQQIAPFETDSYSGEAGYSAPLYENDFATFKPRCDVLLHGSAYSQHAVTERQVGIKLGELEKMFKVIGPRYYEMPTMGYVNQISEPGFFVKQKISYDTAYGGCEKTGEVDEHGEELSDTFLQNPVGIGYRPNCEPKSLIGKPFPQTEQLNQPITDRKNKDYLPQSFGPIARNWHPRYTLAGTYDKHWNDNIKPFLPDDFDEAYYQCAPVDQQVPHLHGGERVSLFGLTAQDEMSFHIPKDLVPMQAILSNGDRHNLNPVIDTLIIEPDEQRFTLVWRARIALKRTIHEVDSLIVGKPSAGWERARMMDKRYLPLEQLNAFKKEIQQQIAEQQRLRLLDEYKNTKSSHQ